jgi:hypothetical protein
VNVVVRIVLVALLVAAATTAAWAEDKLIKLDTRPGVSVSFYTINNPKP